MLAEVSGGRTKFFVVALLSIALAGIALSAAATAEEKIKLHYLTWAAGSADTIREDWIEPFQALHPNIVVEHEAVASFGQFYDKVVAYNLAGNPPDLMHMSVGYVYDFYKQGLLMNIQPFFNRDLKESDFFMEPMKAMRCPSQETGDLYSIPYAFVMSTFFYNQSMFGEMGINQPPSNWTWYDVRDYGRKLVKDANGDGTPDQWGFLSSTDYKLLDVVIHAFGGATLNDKFEVVLDQPNAVAAANFLVDMIWKDRISPASGSANTLFTQKKLAMTIESISSRVTYRNQAAFEWDVVNMPAGPVKKVVRLWPDSFSISAKAKNAEAAWEFIKFAITLNKMDRYSGERKVPIYRKLAMSREWLELDKRPNKMRLIENIPFGDPLEFRPLWNDWYNARNKALDPAWKGTMAVGTAMQNAATAIRNIINAP